MKVHGAYMTLNEFINTCRQGNITFDDGDGVVHYLPANRILTIPDYQREYRWGVKENSELFYDISYPCYLGQIALAKDNNCEGNYLLVDGQQRITSIIMLYTVLVYRLYLDEDTLNIKKYDLHKATNNLEHDIPRLNFNTNCFTDFQSFISQIYTLSEDEFTEAGLIHNGVDSYRQRGQYAKTLCFLHQLIKKEIDNKDNDADKRRYILDSLNSILNSKISVVIFEGDNNFESERVFIDINEKGLRLDNEDILKAYYLQLIPYTSGEQALQNWKQLKQVFFDLRDNKKFTKMPLESFINIYLQIILLTEFRGFDFNKFDNNLRYTENNRTKHICEWFNATKLHSSFGEALELAIDIYKLGSMDKNSQFYLNYFNGRDSTTRYVAHFLFQSLFNANMQIIYMAFIKLWYLRNKEQEKITCEDIIQLYVFYIITNVSGEKKEKPIYKNGLFGTNSIDEYNQRLQEIEVSLLQDSVSKSTTLIKDPNNGQLSFNIQMTYNDFTFCNNRWTIKITNETFLDKYSYNRDGYCKDHFLVQNGNTVLLHGHPHPINIPTKLKRLRARVYNFIYHEDVYDNKDFFSRLLYIHSKSDRQYGQYELDYFQFIIGQMCEYLEINRVQITQDQLWDMLESKYVECINSNKYQEIVSFILEENILKWNKHICRHFENQIPKEICNFEYEVET